jgi:hypothetical protein
VQVAGVDISPDGHIKVVIGKPADQDRGPAILNEWDAPLAEGRGPQ